ncbi:hypothetical protein D3C81_858230 [compost metagenome]
MLVELALQVGAIVVQKSNRHGLRRLHALPQRSMGLHVEVHGDAGPGQALQQAHVGGPARLRQHARFAAQIVREFLFEAVLAAAFLQEDGRHQHGAAALQDARLGRQQRRLAGNVQVIITCQHDRTGRHSLPFMQVLAAEQLLDALDVMFIHARAHKGGHPLFGVDGAGRQGGNGV